MAEFRTLEYGPMDRAYHEAISETPHDSGPQLEAPIAPINELGETVPEHDPSGRFKNIIQTTQAAIRGGAGTLQIVLMTPHESAIGGRPKAYGKEVREALKEVALASKVNIAGVELPTSLNNLAGFDHQQGIFSDEKRKQSLDEVRDAIRFAADIGRGGGVDIVSWEFPRGVNDAEWNKPVLKDGKEVRPFVQEGEQRIGWLVDDRTGRTMQIRKDEVQHIPYDKKTFEPLRPGAKELEKLETGEIKELPLSEFEWDDFKRWADHTNEQLKKGIDPDTGKPWGIDPETNQQWAPEKKQLQQERQQAREIFEQKIKEGKLITPDEKYIDVQLKGQINSLVGWRTHYAKRAQDAREAMETAEQEMREAEDDQSREKLRENFKKARHEYEDSLHTSHGQQQQINELKERFKHIKPIKDYALERSARTYAEAGVEAMRTYEQGREKGTVERPLHVGPEIGWPGYYGSHPDEFIDLVQNSRKQMVELLTQPSIKDVKGNPINNPYCDPTINKQKAQELADKHIKGLFDTSHMGMWLAHFEAKPGESEEKRIERFKKDFYLPAVEKIIKANVVGGVQLVDSMSAAHGHLPPGEGIFPVMETAKLFKESGFTGFMVSEGHEEEKFGEGRIRSKLWQHAGANVGAGYFSGPPLRWGQVQQGYFGKSYSPLFMFGGYSPSNEFKLWSEVPLE